jgi:lysophospholipase L1-like esterase
MGATRRKRQARPRSMAVPRLRALILANASAAEDVAPGAVISAVLGATGGSTLALVDDGGGRFALSGDTLLAGMVALDRETATSHAITLRETLAGHANSPRDTVLTIEVLNVFEAPDLGPLSLSRTTFFAGSSESGAIIGATEGSAISASGLPAGLSIDGAARSWDWDGEGTVGAGSLSLTESLADSANSPRLSVIDWEVADAPAVSISAEFPVLKAAYEAGERALISWIGDSTVANAGGLAEESSTTGYLREYLADAGLGGVTGGCFSAADKGLQLAGMATPQAYGPFYDPDAVFDASFVFYALEDSAFGKYHPYSTVAGDKVRYDPNGYYDRVELFYPTFSGGGAFDIRIGATVVASIDNNQPVAFRKTATYSVDRTNDPIDQVVVSGTAWPGTLRVWDSTASRTLQAENLGVCSYRCSDWIDTGNDRRAGATVPLLGCHLAIIQLGVNEQNTGVSAATYQANLTALIERLKGAGSDVLVCLPPPALSGYAMSADHRAAVPAACAAAGIGEPVDLYDSIGFDTGADLADTVHPNASGNYKIVNGGVGPRLLGIA